MPEENKEEIVAFNPSKVMDGIRTKIQESIIDLISKEQWDAMVIDEYKKFMEPVIKKDNWNKTTVTPAGITKLIEEQLEIQYKDMIKEFIS